METVNLTGDLFFDTKLDCPKCKIRKISISSNYKLFVCDCGWYHVKSKIGSPKFNVVDLNPVSHQNRKSKRILK